MKKEQNKNQSQGMNRRKMLQKTGLVLAAAPFYFGLESCVSGGKKSFDADVIIIGAGLSGLNAALTLENIGYKVMVVEATNRFGGRVHTAKESDVPGHPELGANGIGGGYARLLDAAQKYGVSIGPMRPRTEPRKGEILYAVNNNLILPKDWSTHAANPMPEGFRNGSPTSPAWSVYSTSNPLPKNDLMAWQNPEYAQWDKSVYTILKEKGFSDEAIKLAVSTNSSYGADAKTISVLMYFQILNFITQQSGSSGKGGAAIGGNQRIPEAMAGAFKQDILLESPVKSIASEADGATVTLKSEKKLRAPYVICTLPASALRNIKMSPFPEGKQGQAFQNLAYTPCAQIHFVPTKKYWEEDGLPPSMWCDNLAGRFMALCGECDPQTGLIARPNRQERAQGRNKSQGLIEHHMMMGMGNGDKCGFIAYQRLHIRPDIILHHNAIGAAHKGERARHILQHLVRRRASCIKAPPDGGIKFPDPSGMSIFALGLFERVPGDIIHRIVVFTRLRRSQAKACQGRFKAWVNLV
jgi:monoamine oxidase